MSASTNARPSLLSKVSAAVAARPNIALATIVVLTILVIALYVYYRGFLMFGPYYKPVITAMAVGGAPTPPPSAPAAAPPAAAGDAETERLIESINGS
jgi:hypothetical protein